MLRGGIGIECRCPEERDDHSDCVRCGGFGTIWINDPSGFEVLKENDDEG